MTMKVQIAVLLPIVAASVVSGFSAHPLRVHRGISLLPLKKAQHAPLTATLQSPSQLDAGSVTNGIANATVVANVAPSSAPAQQPPSQLQSIVLNAKSLVSIDKERKDTLLTSSASGLTMTLAMIPEAIAFSFVAGVHPLVGLWTTVTLGFFAAAFGGRAGIVSSASGACSVVVASLCASHGAPYLAACAILAGLMQVAGGYMGIGKFIRLVPHPVMLGFVNGLAVVMTKSQLHHFTGFSWNSPQGLATYGLTALTMALIKLLPKVTKKIPATLGAIVVTTLIAVFGGLPVQTLGDVAGASTFTGGLSVLPKLGLPAVPFTLATLKTIFPYAFTVAAVGAIESLLTMQLVDGVMDDGKRGSTKKEMIGQGVGNAASGLVGGFGGCALLGLSIVNVQSGGGLSRWSGMSFAVFLALALVTAAPLLAKVPIASLTGVMLLVCYKTFSWSSLRLLNKIPRLDALVIALVSIVTVRKDLAVAVLYGTIASALGFAWKQSTNISAEAETTPTGEKVYKLRGPLFFGSIEKFQDLFSSRSDPKKVVLDFKNSRVFDHSALQAINGVADSYGEQGKTVVLRGLSSDGAQLLGNLRKGKQLPQYQIVEYDPQSDPAYMLAEESDVYADLKISVS